MLFFRYTNRFGAQKHAIVLKSVCDSPSPTSRKGMYELKHDY